MAKDLIPPPSPAGRPTSPGGVPNLIELPPEPPRSPAQPVQKEAPGPSAFRNRFGFLMGALAGVVVAAALIVAVVVLTNDDPAASEGLAANWSRWQPPDTSVQAGASQIAKKVGAEYTHTDGHQLTSVTGEQLAINVALRPASGPIAIFGGTNVLYQLNGLGPNGSIKGGKPSQQRQQLVRREALELALYTFRYLPDVDGVVALLPPPPPAAGANASPAQASLLNSGASSDQMLALFYRPGDLKPQLQIPLGMTVGAKAPAPEKMGGAEGKMVDQLTMSNLFKWSLIRSQDSTPYLVLDRPPTP
jgi:hypothetical protein